MEEQTTKERILTAAEEIMLEKSFHSVGLKQILDAARVPKGSFYHYFSSKEQFGVEMLKDYMGESTTAKQQALSPKNLESDPVKRLFNMLDGAVTSIESVSEKFPCLALKLASEVVDLSEPMREELAKGFEKWITLFVDVFEEAKKKGVLSETLNSSKEAQLIHDLMTGSIHRAVINRSAEPVRNAVESIKDRISSKRTG
ncbi:TetR/AcrR family transcriptional regulator [Desulforhopalus vacuolatus]|uniref:TetR/AcrR family transcriptional regulator n=1 Tax=Desulforhopalus vacuolatus TaxID=40414 RepID=UPI0019659CDE|nr:TetR/AcrR family transcriptional regulator [Desulforhopalus vacuolatus]MBM9520806.1 TetR/AcrR family transcriptional regulator [Desulforhopalus vacuolatus]